MNPTPFARSLQVPLMLAFLGLVSSGPGVSADSPPSQIHTLRVETCPVVRYQLQMSTDLTHWSTVPGGEFFGDGTAGR